MWYHRGVLNPRNASQFIGAVVLATLLSVPAGAQAQSDDSSFGSALDKAVNDFNKAMEGLSDKEEKKGGSAEDGKPSDKAGADSEGAAKKEKKQAQSLEERIQDALDQSDELRRKIRETKAQMADIFHKVRIAQKVIGTQYVRLGRDIANVQSVYKKAMAGDAEGADLFQRLEDAAATTQRETEKVTTYAIRYENKPDLKGMILKAHRNTLKISALEGAIRELRGDYAEIFEGVEKNVAGVDPESLQGGIEKQKRLLRQVSATTNRMTTPLIRTTVRSEAVLRDVADRYRDLDDRMDNTVETFNEAGEKFYFEAGKQIAKMGLLLASLTQDTDGIAGVLGKIGTAITLVEELESTRKDLQQFREFYDWFVANKDALKNMNEQTASQSASAADAVSGIVKDVRGYRREIIGGLQDVYAGQEATLETAAAEFEKAAEKAESEGREKAKAERKNLATSVSTNFPSAASAES